MLTRNVTLVLHHQQSKARNIVIHSCLFGGQLYTYPLIIPDVHQSNPNATFQTLFQLAGAQDKSFIDSCKHAVNVEIAHVKALKHQQLNQLLHDVPHMFRGVSILHGLKKIVDKTIPIYAIKAKTEKLLWHQHLGHPCNKYLYNMHKFVTGVPKFDWQTPLLDQYNGLLTFSFGTTHNVKTNISICIRVVSSSQSPRSEKPF